MIGTLLKTAIISSLILMPSFCFCASGPGTTAANFLKIGIGARAIAMGGAFSALADDGTALYWNPAGLVQIKKIELSTTYNVYFQGIKQGYLSLIFPLLKGSAGLGANYVDMGKIEGRDEYGKPTGDFGASDIQVCIAYARNVSSKVALGINAGMLVDIIAEDKKIAYLGDIGLLFKPAGFVSGGVACQNIGSKLGKDPLPLTFRGGIALRLKFINVETDVVKPIDDGMYNCAGFECWIRNILAIRAGYRTSQDIGSGASFGTGFKISMIQFDYAYVPYGDLGNAQRISLQIEF